jgi:hypothetical protein
MRRRDAMTSYRRLTIKDVAYQVMEEAYMKASAGNTLPAAARQIMYAARGRIQDITGKMLDDQYFCQTLLPDYMASHPSKTSEWDVVFDARGNFIEPFDKSPVPLGTLQVRDYLAEVSLNDAMGLRSNPEISLETRYPTKGPRNRYSAILFLEKEGFAPLLKKVKLAERYDLAIMSTKGVSVTAARKLVETLCYDHDIPLLIARDFDKAGFSIASTLQNDTRRYTFGRRFRVIDLGLRLADVEAWGLDSEEVSYGKSDPTWNLKENGATADEIDFLYTPRPHALTHKGNRVELNAFPSDQFVKWLESKLDEAGIRKVIPDEETLKAAYLRARKLARLQRMVDEIIDEDDTEIEVPDDVAERIATKLDEERSHSWDDALTSLAAEDIAEVLDNTSEGRA